MPEVTEIGGKISGHVATQEGVGGDGTRREIGRRGTVGGTMERGGSTADGHQDRRSIKTPHPRPGKETLPEVAYAENAYGWTEVERTPLVRLLVYATAKGVKEADRGAQYPPRATTPSDEEIRELKKDLREVETEDNRRVNQPTTTTPGHTVEMVHYI